MSLDDQIRKALAEFKKTDALVFTATVKAVNETAKTITVTDVDDFEFNDVRLAAAEDDKKSVLVIPKLESTVLVTMIGNDQNTLFVSKVNEVESILGVIDKTEFKVNESGYQIIRDGESLKTVLNDYIDEVNKIKVIYGNTINVVNTTAIKQRLNKILIE